MTRRQIVSVVSVLGVVLSIFGAGAAAQPGQQCPPDPGCTLKASLENDYVLMHGGADSEVTLQVFESPGGQSVHGPETFTTDGDGVVRANLAWPADIDLVPGMVIVMQDPTASTTKELQLADLDIQVVDPESDVVAGTAPTRASVSITGAASAQTTADGDGKWTVDFAGLGYDVQYDDAVAAEVFDDDGDGTIDEGGVPLTENPPPVPCPGPPEDCPSGAPPRPCIETSTRICGTAGADTIRFSNGEALAGGESDTLILRVGSATDDSIVDPGTSDDGFVIDLDEAARRAWRSSGSAPVVLIKGSLSSSLLGFLPPRPGALKVKMIGSHGIDLVSSFFPAGSKTVSTGRYRLEGQGGADVMDTGDGTDLLIGGGGDDWLDGNNGKDTLVGGRGVDFLVGGRGYDTCYATKEDTTFGCERIVKRRNI